MNISKLKNKEKKLKLTTLGFTLIELLAVIVILAIIALIAIPVIMNIISKANKSAFKDSAYGIIKAGELYYSEKLLEVDGMTNDVTFTFPEADGLDLKESIPTSGNMKVSKEGKVALAISNGKYCIRKGYNDVDITVDEKIEDCEISIKVNPIITTNNSCLKSGICPKGTKLNIKVNDTENYDFYVIKDENNELTLIMNRNLVNKGIWISEIDYANALGTNYGENGNNEKGPLTVLEELENITSGWINIPMSSYTLIDDKPDQHGDKVRYESIVRTNTRARMLTYTEAIGLGCTYKNDSCPKYLYVNTYNNGDNNTNGYWLSTASSSASHIAWTLYYTGYVICNEVNNNTLVGLRPVITIPKTL